ncbi:MAG: carboxylating nicotinate-nucleotide diphosphorylase, partial [Candidatus Riflebacteria bacterium]
HEDLQDKPDLTALLIPDSRNALARVITREDMILCGKGWVDEVFHHLNPDIKLEWNFEDGDEILADSLIFSASGKARSLLTGERTALNFLQTLSGVATITRRFVNQMGQTTTKLLDTRKTVPGLRLAEKYAVKCGGGHNHRMGLFDAFLIKENHIMACGSITEAVHAARNIAPDKSIEVEVENLEQLKEAIEAEVEVVMLDNFSITEIIKAVEVNAQRVKLEVSGDVNLDNIGTIAATGVDFISVGSLTKHIKAINLSMRFDFRIF